jgi:hypothetical protein
MVGTGESRQFFLVRPNGRYSTHGYSSCDIIGEWRDPRTWTVYVVEYSDGFGEVTLTPGRRKILARVTVTEGEGLESDRSDFEKDMM